MSRWLLRTIALSLLLFSCDSSRVYESFHELPQGWSATDTITFDVGLEDMNREYRLTTQFRCSNTYPYSNLYYQLILKSIEGEVLSSGLEQVFFFEQKTGKPLGDGLGDFFTVEQSVDRSWPIGITDSARVQIVQYMRIDTLQGIDRVGLRINLPHIED